MGGEKMKTKKEIVEEIIEEGIEGLLKNIPHFLKDYGNEKERLEAIKECGYEEGQAEALTIQEILSFYEEIVEAELINKNLLYYVDIAKLIADEITSGFLDYVVLENGNVYFVREI